MYCFIFWFTIAAISYSTGMIRRVNAVALTSPVANAVAMGDHSMDLLGIPIAMGRSPKIVVTVVINTGRILALQASMMDSLKPFPSLFLIFIKSTRIRESFTATPASPTTAIKLPMVNVDLVRNIPNTTPMNAKATAEIMIKG